MSRRAKGTYTLVENRAAAYIKQTRDASSSVLMALVERSNYSHKAPMTIAEIMVDTGLMQRAVEKALLRLEALGLASKSAKCWTFPVTNSEASQSANEAASGHTPQVTNEGASQDANGNAYQKAYNGTQSSGENIDQHSKGDSLKEVEGSKKELKDKNTPLTPQGGKGQSEPEQPEPGTPPAADLRPAQDSSTAPQEPSPAKGLEEVPRRRAAPAFDPLTCELPACVPAELWAEWVAHRRQIKKSLTQAAAVLTLRGLETAHNNGWDVTNLVHDAIANRWSGCVFDEQRQPNPRAAPAALPPRRNYDEPAPTDDFTPRRSYE